MLNKKIFVFVLGIFLIGFISSLEDTQLIQICNGDSELLIGCMGDEELIFLAGETPEEALTGLNAESKEFIEPEEPQPEVTLPVLERIKSNPFILFCIFGLGLIVFCLYGRKRKFLIAKEREKKDEWTRTKFLIPIFLSIFFISFISASYIPIFPNPGINEAGNLIQYEFNFTQYENCSNVILSHREIIQINSRGFGFTIINLSEDMSNYTNINFLCEYRDNTLRKVHNHSSQFFDKVFVKDLYVSNNLNVTKNISTSSLTISDFSLAGIIKNDVNGLLSGGNLISLNDLDANYSTLNRFFNGAVNETINGTVTSDGTTISFNLEKAGTGDFIIKFSDGFYLFDATPRASISLTAGSDTSPQTNYIYIPKSTNLLTVSTTAFPTTEYSPVATVIVQSASTVQLDGALKVHIWTDHLAGSNNQGHLSDINLWVRKQHSTWLSGVVQTLTITTNVGTPDNVDFATTSGIVLQLHSHTFPELDTSTGSDIYVVNDATTPYTTITDLNSLLTDSAGVSMSGDYFNLVIWGSVSEDSGDSHLFVNLPSGSYIKQSDAIADVSGYTNYNIPSDFKGASFLISKITLQHSVAGGGTWTSIQETDLRGQIPNIVAGGGTTSITTEFADNTFRLFDETDVTKELQFQLDELTTGNTRTIIFPDRDLNLSSPIFTTINVTGISYIGEKITFAFGEFIDNLVDGWIKITGNLNVTGNVTSGEKLIDEYGIIRPKQYVANSSLGPGDFNVTGTGWTTVRAVAIPYQTSDGAWRMKFNIYGTISSVAGSFTGTLSGVTFKNVANYYQAISGNLEVIGTADIPPIFVRVNPNSGQFRVDKFGTYADFNKIMVSGDVELDSKPDWAD